MRPVPVLMQVLMWCCLTRCNVRYNLAAINSVQHSAQVRRHAGGAHQPLFAHGQQEIPAVRFLTFLSAQACPNAEIFACLFNAISHW